MIRSFVTSLAVTLVAVLVTSSGATADEDAGRTYTVWESTGDGRIMPCVVWELPTTSSIACDRDKAVPAEDV